MSKQILVLPGDGIGPEIMAEAVKVLELANDRFQLGFELAEDVIGGAAIDKHGVPLADQTLQRARQADAVLLGAVGGPKWDRIERDIRPERGLLKIRSQLGLFANLRPVRSDLAPEGSPLRPERGSDIDMLFVRELTVGVGDTDVKAGIIKVATGSGAITDYEKTVLTAASMVSSEDREKLLGNGVAGV